MKKLIIPVLILTFVIGFYFYNKSTPKVDDSNISSYRNNSLGITFKYPKILTTTGDNRVITIHHEVPFSHHDFCDFKGESTTTIPTLTDLNITMHITEKNLIETMKTESPYIPEENFLNGEVVPSPGFIDTVDFGNLKGFSIFEGAEGCGHTVYYFKIADKRTLVVINEFITIFSGSYDTDNMNRALAVPGVINNTESQAIFDSIIKSMTIQ